MMLKRFVGVVVALVVGVQAGMLSAQQLRQPDASAVGQSGAWPGGGAGQGAWTVQPLPPVDGAAALGGVRPAGFVEPAEQASAWQQPAAQNLAAPVPGGVVGQAEAPVPVVTEAELDEVEPIELVPTPPKKRATGLGDFWGYRYEQTSMDWIVGDEFGMFSWNGDHYQPAGIESGLGVGIDIHWINGPSRTDMPPRLYDFSIAYQCRRRFGPLGYDVAASVMASSDFEGSAREGIRFPAHAVGFLQVCPTADLVFGVDYLDRGDIKLLPVAGLIWTPRDDVRLELVFPRPRATFRLPECGWPWGGGGDAPAPAAVPGACPPREHRLYIAGELGGGSWAIERIGQYDDFATYRDLRLSVGLECVDTGGMRSAIEFSYLFARRLEFTSGDGNGPLEDAAMIRWICSY